MLLPLYFISRVFVIIAVSLTNLAGHIYIRQKVHFYFYYAVALTGLAAAALDVKGKTSGIVSSDFLRRVFWRKAPVYR